jgi:hypothetical protein
LFQFGDPLATFRQFFYELPFGLPFVFHVFYLQALFATAQPLQRTKTIGAPDGIYRSTDYLI